MRFQDCSKFYNSPDIFQLLGKQSLALMHINSPDWKIPFLPVITRPDLPIRIAFIGLNAYCGNDNLEAIRQQNFTVWCQERYNSKIFTVIGLYESALQKNWGQHSSFFTNFIKVALPEDHFKDEGSIRELLNQSPELRSLYENLLRQEIHHLVENGCRVFISFGNAASSHLRAVIDSSSDSNCSTVSGKIEKFIYSGKNCYLIPEKHYSRYGKKNTEELISELQIALTSNSG